MPLVGGGIEPFSLSGSTCNRIIEKGFFFVVTRLGIRRIIRHGLGTRGGSVRKNVAQKVGAQGHFWSDHVHIEQTDREMRTNNLDQIIRVGPLNGSWNTPWHVIVV